MRKKTKVKRNIPAALAARPPNKRFLGVRTSFGGENILKIGNFVECY